MVFRREFTEYLMSHDFSFPERALMSSKELTVRDANRIPDATKPRANAEEAINLFFDSLLRPPALARDRS